MSTGKKKKTTKKKKTSSRKKKLLYPLLPLRDIVIFPHMVVPFFVGREKSILALEAAMDDKSELLLCAQKNSDINEPQIEDIFKVGTLSTIIQMVKLPDGTLKVLVEGKKRAIVSKHSDGGDFVTAEIEILDDTCRNPIETEAMMRSLRSSFEAYVKLNKRIAPEILITIQNIDDPSKLADTIVAHLNLKHTEKQNLLELYEPQQRIEKLLAMLEGEIEILEVEKKIRSRVKKQMERGQKEYYLNEQMSAIQKELGERDEFKTEILDLERKIKNSGLSSEAREKADAELRKLKMMAPMSAESTVVRIYLEWLVSLPWRQTTKDNLDLEHAEKVLNEDHFGLEKIKERIIEYLAVKVLNPDSRGSILCLVGPPGVGKTSLATSIAKAVEKKFARIALGGLRDEAEIRGHRRTYIGALPGKIIQAIKKAGSNNPLILLDEVDKMGTDFRGDPASAMLEVLDPEQNKSFNDHYLEIDYDLSKCLFIATANTLSGIPLPLVDRMEIINLSSYTEIEKLHIANKHLAQKQLKEHGLAHTGIRIDSDSLLALIRHYTREAGVRNLEREIAKVTRKAAKRYIESNKKLNTMVIKPKDIVEFLGPHKFKYGQIEEHHEIGMTMGLAWTEVGGDTLKIEVSILPGKGKLTLTGKLGDVMQESAQAAYSYIRSQTDKLGLPKDFYQRVDVHIHAPEGAIPKDGPSAGTTMATSIASALTLRPVSKDVAMTGEITLRGHVLEIGGLKEKLLAANRAGIKTVFIPKDNEKDLYDVPKEITSTLEIFPVSHVDEILDKALLEAKTRTKVSSNKKSPKSPLRQ